MKKEIRNIKAGLYESPCKSIILKISKNDQGNLIECIDKDADSIYSFLIDDDKVISCNIEEFSKINHKEL